MDRSRTVTYIAQKLVSPFPHAKAHLQHYLQGSGKAVEINLAEIWEQDEGMRSLFSYTVRPMIQRGSTSGSLIIPQTHLSTWNWRLALGSMTYNWAVDGQDIAIESHTTYKWSPDEQRITRPLHEALDQLKHEEASPFEIIGKPFTLSLRRLPNICSCPQLSLHRKLYL